MAPAGVSFTPASAESLMTALASPGRVSKEIKYPPSGEFHCPKSDSVKFFQILGEVILRASSCGF